VGVGAQVVPPPAESKGQQIGRRNEYFKLKARFFSPNTLEIAALNIRKYRNNCDFSYAL